MTLEQIAKKTERATSTNRDSWVHLYYNIQTGKAYTTKGTGREYITDLINPQTKEQIQRTIDRFLWL